MKRFAQLYRELDGSTATLDKRAALVAYFREAPPEDAVWALWLLSGAKLAKIANTRELREWIVAASGQPDWLLEESHDHVGDLAETLTLLLDDPQKAIDDTPVHVWIEQRLLPVAGGDVDTRREIVTRGWRTLDVDQRLLFNKLLTGELRVGVSQRTVQQALVELSGVDIARIAQRMLGAWKPASQFLEALLSAEETAGDRAQPYPFYLASPLEIPVDGLGDKADWLLEWKWDGIRLQLLRRGGEIALWSRGEERLDGRFPEIEAAATALPDGTVLDGELLAWRYAGVQADGAAGAPLPFTALQKRIQRRKPGAKILAECPVVVQCYDLLEADGEDWRERPLRKRRERLAQVITRADTPLLRLSGEVQAASWEQARERREDARTLGAEGLMIKRLTSSYRHGRPRGDWWKWKIDPLTIDAVLIYAQPGHGRRSTLFTDYTFGLWDGDKLVPVAKAYSGLDDREIATLDQWIRTHTLTRFGPVRSVAAEHVFELGFEAVNASPRHKSGIAVRFPRILRWRADKRPEDADHLDALKALAR